MKLFTPLTSVAIVSIVATTAIVASPQIASAYHQTNKSEVKGSLENGWSVIYAKEFSHVEYGTLAGAIVVDANGGAGSATTAYFTNYAKESLLQIKAQAANVSSNVAKNALEQLSEVRILSALKSSLKNGVVDIPLGGVNIQVGIASYNRAECAKVYAPTLRNPRRTVEKCVPTPNTHQPYIRYQLK